MNDPAVIIKGLRKEYPGLMAVDGLDLIIPKGCVYGMIGPNGSGKTTTIKLLMGLLKADAGTATLLGEAMGPRAKHPRVSYMPQELAIYLDLTVRDNLELIASIYGVPKERQEERINRLLTMVDLEGRKDSLVGQLSGGMRHRTSLACSLVNDPELVFLDEPTVGVDPELRAGFWQHFHELKIQGKTIVLTTHYMDEAMHCDLVCMMHKGKILATGTPRSLLDETGKANLEDAFLEYMRRGKA
jgi:ABC-2 type transport system ATP-binding protein